MNIYNISAIPTIEEGRKFIDTLDPAERIQLCAVNRERSIAGHMLTELELQICAYALSFKSTMRAVKPKKEVPVELTEDDL